MCAGACLVISRSSIGSRVGFLADGFIPINGRVTERVRLRGSAFLSTLPAAFFLAVHVLFPSWQSAQRGAAPSAYVSVPAALLAGSWTWSQVHATVRCAGELRWAV